MAAIAPAKVLALKTPPNVPLRVSSHCVSRAVQSLKTVKPPIAALPSLAEQSRTVPAMITPSSSSKSSTRENDGHATTSPSPTIERWLPK